MPITRRLRAGMLALVLVFALAVATAGCLRSTSPTDTATTADARLQHLVDDWRQRAGVPAVTLAVHGGGRTRFVAASGTGQWGGGIPVTADAQFRIASITKMFIATVILQLVEEGRLRLDAPVTDYVPGYPLARGVTIRHVLNHTSGIPDYGRTNHFNEGLLAHRDRRWTSDQILALVRHLRRDFPPGTDYSYSNTGYIVLGKVIDGVTGSTWAGEIRRRILDPLQLRHTYIPGFEQVSGRVIPGYIDVNEDGHDENVETGAPWPSLETSEGSAGAIVSTAADLATFADALFHGRLVRPATLQQMVAEGPHHPRRTNYGLGVEIYRPDYRLTLWGHGGATLGFKSILWYAPKHDMVVVVLTNNFAANQLDLAELVIRTETRPHR
jgi:D-alanyl-D-alanine carboxypeptidase